MSEKVFVYEQEPEPTRICCACRNTFLLADMEQISPSGTWGTCKQCFRFMWEAGSREKQRKAKAIETRRVAEELPVMPVAGRTMEAGALRRETALGLMRRVGDALGKDIVGDAVLHSALYDGILPELHHFEALVRAQPAVHLDVLRRLYVLMLTNNREGQGFVAYHAHQQVVFATRQIDGIAQVQFYRGSVENPFGDPMAADEAVAIIFAFLGGEEVGEAHSVA